MTITFDQGTPQQPKHEYHINGRRALWSATEVLREMGLYGSAPDFIHPIHKDFGTAVHRANHLFMAGGGNPKDPDDYGRRLDPDRTNPRILARVRGLKKFLADTGFKPVLMECHVAYSGVVAGTIDAYGLLNNRKTLVDWKGLGKMWAYHLQTALYKMALEQTKGVKVEDRLCVHLADDDYKVEPHDDPRDFNWFLEALSLLQAKHEHKVR